MEVRKKVPVNRIPQHGSHEPKPTGEKCPEPVWKQHGTPGEGSTFPTLRQGLWRTRSRIPLGEHTHV